MKTSTKAQGPLYLGGEYITIGNTIYNFEGPEDYTNATGELRAFLDGRLAEEKACLALQRQQETQKTAQKATELSAIQAKPKTMVQRVKGWFGG